VSSRSRDTRSITPDLFDGGELEAPVENDVCGIEDTSTHDEGPGGLLGDAIDAEVASNRSGVSVELVELEEEDVGGVVAETEAGDVGEEDAAEEDADGRASSFSAPAEDLDLPDEMFDYVSPREFASQPHGT
jgi:hypothetical protein